MKQIILFHAGFPNLAIEKHWPWVLFPYYLVLCPVKQPGRTAHFTDENQDGILGRWRRPHNYQHKVFANSVLLKGGKWVLSPGLNTEHRCYRKEHFSYALNLPGILNLSTLVCWWGNWGPDKLRALPQVKSLYGSRRTQKDLWLSDSQLSALLPHIIMWQHGVRPDWVGVYRC